jgi:5-methylcytosine-specific restriction enzyme subunit McrC
MIEIMLKEGGNWQPYELTPAQVDELSRTNLVEMQSRRNGKWQLRAHRYTRRVGAVRLGHGAGALEVRIAPKITIARLLFLVGYADQKESARWQDVEVGVGEAADLVPAVALAFGRAADRALSQGVLLGYTEIDDTAMIIRGKVRVGDQIRQRYSFPVPVERRYDDYTSDIPENRLLLTAAQQLLRLSGIHIEAERLLRRVVLRLAGVSPLDRGTPPPRWMPTRLNARYHTALGLAELVMRGSSYELEPGRNVRVDGLLISMWQLFQDFVTAALDNALQAYGGQCRFQYSQRLDRTGYLKFEPDVIYYGPRADGSIGSPAAVADVKYTLIEGPRDHRSHLYQVISYCTALGVRRGYLLYAEGPSSGPRTLPIQRSGIEITQYPLDLTQPPRNLLDQIEALAESIAGP